MKTQEIIKRGPKTKPDKLRRSAVSVMFNNAEIEAMGGREEVRLFCQDKVSEESKQRQLNELGLKKRKSKTKNYE